MHRPWAYPIQSRPATLWESLALVLEWTVGFCPVCRRYVVFRRWTDNFRDSGFCSHCNSFCRQRQIALVVEHVYRQDHRYAALADNELVVYNTEARGSLHRELSASSRSQYVASEYFGFDVVPGQRFNGTRHEDVQHLSFPSGSIDLVISSDVWEHVPLPYQAHEEVLRVLKLGGHHVFTVPFHQTQFLDDVRATPNADGAPSLLKPPIYHSDPMSTDGALVYTIFSLQMLVRLAEIGYSTTLHRLYAPRFGILGNNALVFDAHKTL